MPYTTYAKNGMLDQFFRNAGNFASTVYMSLHTADPGENGTSEVTGGAPAYSRQVVSFNPAASGNLDSSNQPVFNVPSGVTITHVGFWDSSSGGDFLAYDPVTNETFATQGTYSVIDADLNLNL